MRNVFDNELITDEWYTPLDIVIKAYELLNVRYKSTIMCPYDTAESQFVQWGQKTNNSVIYGITDYLDTDYQYDYVLTNPPFSIKDQVIERVLKSGKPGALILPLDSLGGVKRHALWKQYGYPSIYVPAKRMRFIDGTGQGRDKVSFHCIIMLLNVGKSEIIWE
jgi:hypothetical protein